MYGQWDDTGINQYTNKNASLIANIIGYYIYFCYKVDMQVICINCQ